MTSAELARKFGVPGPSISGWTKPRIKAGIIEWCNEYGDAFTDDKAWDTAKRRGQAYLKVTDTYNCETVAGLLTPYELTGDPEWDEGGPLRVKYDLELKKRTAVRSVLSSVKAVVPLPNPVGESETVSSIHKSRESDDGDRVLFRNPGGKENIFKIPQEGPGNGHDKEELDDATRALMDELAPFVKVTKGPSLTPHLCRKGCKHYDPIGDPNGGDFREYCCVESQGTKIERDNPCGNFESTFSLLPEGVLTF